MQRLLLPLLGLLALTGCAAAGSAITGLTTAGVAGSVGSATGSAALGVAAGFGVSFGVDQGVKYGERRMQGNVQDVIAETAGPLEIGQAARWEVPDRLPLGGKSGKVEVARAFGEGIPCKDVVFTVEDDRSHDIYTTTVCQNDDGTWHWATAEPDVHRWGHLQ